MAYIAVGLSAGLAAWSGVRGAETHTDAILRGLIMFVIAVLGCHGWGWAARTWKDGHPIWATIAGLVLTVAMAVTLIGGAGSFYGAATEKMAVAERGSDAFNRASAELKKIEKRREKLTAHRSQGEIEPDITQAKADKRYKATNECDPQHITKSLDFCASFRALERELAAAKEAERLDKLAEPHNTIVGKGRPTQGGGWGGILAIMLGISDQQGNALFSLLTTIALDMGAVVAVLTAELREDTRHQEGRREPKNDMRPLDRIFARWRRRPREVETMEAVETDAEPEPAKIEPPPRPRLVVSENKRPAGSIAKILSDALEPAKGRRVEMGEIYAAYAGECARRGLPAVLPAEFVDPLERVCMTFRIKTAVEGDKVYLLNVRLVRNEAKEQPPLDEAKP